ncbi:MAG: UpxY family transcription antiterminator [Bacteroidota bacterium]
MGQWYAIYVNSRAEKKVVSLLNAKNIEAYTPIVKVIKQWSDRKKSVELPILSGYVFVREIQTDQDKILQTKGVVNFVRSDGKMAIVRDIEIERLKQLVQLGYQFDTSQTNKIYSRGEKVKITSGVLKNLEGYVLENEDGKFIEIVLESIGQSIKAKLPKEILLSS